MGDGRRSREVMIDGVGNSHGCGEVRADEAEA